MMKKAAALLTAIMVLFNTVALYADGSGSTLQELKQEADAIYYQSSISNEDAEKLAALLDDVLKLDSEDVEAYKQKAFALDFLGKSKEADDLYDKATVLMPRNSDLLYNKATHLMTYKNYNAAIQSYEKFLKSDDKAFIAGHLDQVWTDEAEAYYSLKKYKEAISCIDKFVAKGSYYYNFDYAVKKGIALLELKKYSEASKWLEELKKHVVPDEIKNLGTIYYYSACAASMQGNSWQALANLSFAFKFDPEYKSKARTEKYLAGINRKKEFLDLVSFDDNLLNKLELGKDFYVIDHLKYDLDGDKSNEDIVLAGRKCVNGNYNVDQVSLVIVNNKTGKYDLIKPKYTEGIIWDNVADYLFLEDLDGDGHKDIMVKMGGWGTKILFCAYSYNNGKPVMIYGSQETSEGMSFTAKQLDERYAEVQCIETGKSFTIDLSWSPKSEEEKDKEGWVTSFWDMRPVDVDGDKVFELQGYQGINGFGRMYGGGVMITTLKYDKAKGSWTVLNMEHKIR